MKCAIFFYILEKSSYLWLNLNVFIFLFSNEMLRYVEQLITNLLTALVKSEVLELFHLLQLPTAETRLSQK